jgi:hypothetical protein
MALLDRFGLATPLDNARIDVFGHVEAGWTYYANPSKFVTNFNGFSPDRIFNFEHEDFELDQLDLTIERRVEMSSPKFDAGFRLEAIYGSDARWTHSNGLDFYGPGKVNFANVLTAHFEQYPDEQVDLLQAYFDLLFPVGNGLRMRVGKFESLIGGAVDPNDNPFYSHSLIYSVRGFGLGQPFTQTGVLGTYPINSHLTVDAGFSRGWDQSFKDNNDAIDFIGRASYSFNDRIQASLAMITGPEDDNDDSHYRTILEPVLHYAYSDQLSFLVAGDYGYDGATRVITGFGPPTGIIEPFKSVQWYGVTGYAAYKLNDRFTINARAEWLRDQDGALVPFTRFLPVPNFGGTNLYEATLGLTIVPFPNDQLGANLKVRPEVRVDYCDDPIFGHDLGDNNTLFSAAIDGIFNF